jgi:hypothetical protein
MAEETSEMELDLLRRRASDCGMYVARHLKFDPCAGGGDLYLQRAKRFRGDANGESYLRYSTPDQVHAALGKIERGEFRK